jgi:HAD superfamily hydrolase (TIGR01549 family)
LEVEPVGTFDVVLTDFERTLVRLFDNRADEQEFFDEVWAECRGRGIPAPVRDAAGESPYSLWTKAHRWMVRYNDDALCIERMYHAVARIAVKHELKAAESVRLFEDVPPVLERLQAAEIPVVIVSNNATEAVARVLTESNASDLVKHVVGRHFRFELVGNLKPKPNLLFEALKRSGGTAATALLVGDSVDDMKAGRRAKIGYRVGLLEHSTASRWQLRRAGASVVLRRFGDLGPLLPSGEMSGAH